LNLGLWWRTIRDIPPTQLAYRVEFEIKKRSFPKLPSFIGRPLALGKEIPTPVLRKDYLKALELPNPIAIVNSPANTYTFTFLSQTRELDFPITWNSFNYSRLWQFHLHYFDWIRDILVKAYQEGEIDAHNLGKIQHIIADWIAANPLYSFDGWHPYTTSLRIVNWTYAIAAIPSLKNPTITTSLWHQVNYLHRNKEYFAGGNHLLENLRALIVGGLNFNHPRAEKMVRVAVNQLSQQLSLQILPDGGHYERSPMYHLIVMNLVAESVACLGCAGWTVPDEILNHLAQMLQFAQGIRLANGNYPLWNDAAYNGVQPLDEIVSWVSQLLSGKADVKEDSELNNSDFQLTDALHQKLINNITTKETTKKNQLNISPSPISKFRDSGYYILRNSNNIELAFDAAIPCPQELPPHAHADCLTIDLYYQGQPIIVDTGTSEYKAGEIRDLERSTLAHNTITIANQNQSEIWGSFRVGRKAQPFNVESGNSLEWQWVSAAHNGYTKPPLNAIHHRWVGLGTKEIVIIDYLETAVDTNYISTLHFAPGVVLNYDAETGVYESPLEKTNLYLKVFGLETDDEVKWLDADISKSWYAPEFGRRYPRGKLQIQGLLKPKGKVICTLITLDSKPEAIWRYSDNQGTLQLEQERYLKWHFEKKRLIYDSI